MPDDQFIFSSSWLPSPRFDLRTLAGYNTYKQLGCHNYAIVDTGWQTFPHNIRNSM